MAEKYTGRFTIDFSGWLTQELADFIYIASHMKVSGRGNPGIAQQRALNTFLAIIYAIPQDQIADVLSSSVPCRDGDDGEKESLFSSIGGFFQNDGSSREGAWEEYITQIPAEQRVKMITQAARHDSSVFLWTNCLLALDDLTAQQREEMIFDEKGKVRRGMAASISNYIDSNDECAQEMATFLHNGLSKTQMTKLLNASVGNGKRLRADIKPEALKIIESTFELTSTGSALASAASRGGRSGK